MKQGGDEFPVKRHVTLQHMQRHRAHRSSTADFEGIKESRVAAHCISDPP